MIRAILFDLDETLIDRAETMRRFLLGQHNLFPALQGCSGSEFAAACAGYQQNGYADKLAAYASGCRDLGLGNAGVAEELFEDFKARYGTEPVAFAGVSETLSKLHGSYRMGLVSNGRTKGQRAKINACGIAPFFSSVFISEASGCKKPNHAIFLACLKELSVLPGEAVFVGDNPHADMEPARSLGMRGVWLRNENFPAPTFCDGVIDAIQELPQLIEQFA